MRYLLDVNMLIAWGWEDHEAHVRVRDWIAARSKETATQFYTCPISRLGFVRITSQKYRGALSPQQTGAWLESLLKSFGTKHRALADDAPATVFPDWCKTANQTTDAHLLALAAMHGAKLATLDAGIPGAVLVG